MDRDLYAAQRAELRRLAGRLALSEELHAIRAAELAVAEQRAESAEKALRNRADREEYLEAVMRDLHRRLGWSRGDGWKHRMEIARQIDEGQQVNREIG